MKKQGRKKMQLDSPSVRCAWRNMAEELRGLSATSSALQNKMKKNKIKTTKTTKYNKKTTKPNSGIWFSMGEKQF
jgi:hypothetical protein